MMSKRNLRTTVALAISAVVLVGQAALADETSGGSDQITVHKGLLFSKTDRELRMDLFLPQGSDAAVPCVMVIQGGGFRAQNGQKFRPFAEYLAENGFAAALISYRGSPDHKYPATVADIKAAVRYVRKVSGRCNIDPDRIGAMGRSAGGTLAALLAVTGDVEELEGDAGHPEFSSRIQAAVSFAGVFDFVARFTDQEHIDLQPNVKTKILQNGEWIGPPFSPTNEHWLRASAITHVDAKDPPVLFLHCKDDSTVPWPQSRDMHERMQAAGVKSAIHLYETGGHGFKSVDEESKAAMVRFFREKL